VSCNDGKSSPGRLPNTGVSALLLEAIDGWEPKPCAAGPMTAYGTFCVEPPCAKKARDMTWRRIVRLAPATATGCWFQSNGHSAPPPAPAGPPSIAGRPPSLTRAAPLVPGRVGTAPAAPPIAAVSITIVP